MKNNYGNKIILLLLMVIDARIKFLKARKNKLVANIYLTTKYYNNEIIKYSTYIFKIFFVVKNTMVLICLPTNKYNCYFNVNK